ncbi:MAG: 50S ribosomal protein L18 [Patescibacteria group bacterium]
MISKVIKRKDNREKRRLRIRKKVMGTPIMPRLSVFRSNKYIYGQIIDDTKGRTLVAVTGTKNLEASKKCGELLAKKALQSKIKRVVFDRGGYRYAGRVAKFAEGARQEGLEF